MKISSFQFGDIEIEENRIITFKDGIIGFEHLKKYILLNDGNPLFLWLISIDEPETVFPLFGVKVLTDEYPFKDDFEAFGIVKLDKAIENITINLRAPVYINTDAKTGFQKILDDDKLPLDYKLFIDK